MFVAFIARWSLWRLSLQCSCRSQSLEHLRVSDAGGSRKSCRNGLVLPCRGRERERVLFIGTQSPRFPRGPQSRRWWGRLDGPHLAPWPTPGLDLSGRREFRPGWSPASRRSGEAKPMAKPSFLSAGVHLLACVACRGKLVLVLSQFSKGARSQGEGPQVCRNIVCACSQPQGRFLHFETRQSGVSECARPGEVPPLGEDSVPICQRFLRLKLPTS